MKNEAKILTPRDMSVGVVSMNNAAPCPTALEPELKRKFSNENLSETNCFSWKPSYVLNVS